MSVLHRSSAAFPSRRPGHLGVAIIFTLALAAAGLPGCKTESVEMGSGKGPPRGQKYELSHVKRQLKKLRPGTSRVQTLIALGSPAEYRGNTWIYMPNDPNSLFPSDSIEVYFQNGVFASYEKKPIVLGQRFTDP